MTVKVGRDGACRIVYIAARVREKGGQPMSDQTKRQTPESVRRIMEMGRRFLGGETKQQPAVERRAGMRVELSLTVQVRVGEGAWQPARIRDVNLTGLRIEPAGDARPGQMVTVQFDGYPGVAPGFWLVGKVSRLIADPNGPGDSLAMAVQVDRAATSGEARNNYRLLVLHYVRHRPLLEDVDKGYFEGRCPSCGWVGRVGQRKPQCPHCGGTQLEAV